MKKRIIFALFCLCICIMPVYADEIGEKGFIDPKNNIPIDINGTTNEKGTISKKNGSYFFNNYNRASTYTRNSVIVGAIPSKYDLRDEINMAVYNQGSFGSCWIVSAYSSLEATIQRRTNTYYSFSVMHTLYSSLAVNGGSREADLKTDNNGNTIAGEYEDGGNFDQLTDYLLTSKGPALTIDYPYQKYSQSEVSTWGDFARTKEIKETVRFPGLDKLNYTYSAEDYTYVRSLIKNHLINEGPISTVIFAGDLEEDTIISSLNLNADGSRDYVINYKKQANVEDTKSPNHAVTLIGWDDNYPKENFSTSNRPTSNGAYLIQNSWGSSYTYIWVSYEDLWIEYYMGGFNYDDIMDAMEYNNVNLESGTKATTYGTYINIFGLLQQAYSSKYTTQTSEINTIYAGNKYTKDATKTLLLKQIVFPIYADSAHPAKVTLYINPSNDSLAESDLQLIGTYDNLTGFTYKKIILDEPIELTGSSYAIVMKLEAVNVLVTASSKGKTYIGDSLANVNILVSNFVMPMVLKVSEAKEYQLLDDGINHINQINPGSGAIVRVNLSVNKTNSSDKDIDVVITNASGTDITSQFEIVGTTLYDNKTTLRIKPPATLPVGMYKIKMSYQNSMAIYKEINITNIVQDVSPNLFTTTYDMNRNYVTSINELTSVTAFKNNFNLFEDYSTNLKVLKSDGTELLSGNIPTGSKIVYYDTHNNVIESFENVVNGDCSGDAKITYLDYINTYNHIQKVKHPELSKNLLTGPYFIAADMSGDDKISYLDYVRIYNKIKELKGISN